MQIRHHPHAAATSSATVNVLSVNSDPIDFTKLCHFSRKNTRKRKLVDRIASKPDDGQYSYTSDIPSKVNNDFEELEENANNENCVNFSSSISISSSSSSNASVITLESDDEDADYDDNNIICIDTEVIDENRDNNQANTRKETTTNKGMFLRGKKHGRF